MESASVPDSFPPTRWSLVFRLRDGADSTQAREALAQLCRDYWKPIFRTALRRGHSEHDAKDLTQGFFSHVLEHEVFASADPRDGRMRCFLSRTFKYYRSGVWDRERSLKRGGGMQFFPLDTVSEEDQDVGTAENDVSLDLAFERDWARATMDAALRRLQVSEETAGRTALFSEFQSFLLTSDAAATTYAESANRLAMNEGTVRTAVHRLRQKLRQLLRQQVADTLREPTEALLAEELVALRQALQSRNTR